MNPNKTTLFAVCAVLALSPLGAVFQPQAVQTPPTTAPDWVASNPAQAASTRIYANYSQVTESGSEPVQQAPINNQEFLMNRPEVVVDQEGEAHAVQRYTAHTANDPSANQWWTTKANISPTWSIAPGSTPTLLAIIDTGFALDHEEFSNRWYVNPGESGVASSQAASLLNCTARSLPLNKSCNLIDDNGDGIRDNEFGPTNRENKSFLNCTDQARSIDKACNLLDDDANGYVDDYRGWDFVNGDRSTQAGETNSAGDGTTHGTMVAGIAAATGNNAKGIAGVNWHTKILPLQALDDDSYGDTITVSGAVRYAADRGADVISISLGSNGPDSYLRQAIRYAISKGSVVVASSGNEGCQCISYPANYEEVIAVGASNQSDVPTSFSNWGANLDLLAPGVDMATSTWTASNQTSAYAGRVAGTSFSTPLVAGLLALMRSHQSQVSATNLSGILMEKVARLGLPITTPKTTTFGYGRVDALAALQRVTTPSTGQAQYNFGPVSGGRALGIYEPLKYTSVGQCAVGVFGATEVYRLTKSGSLTMYTTSTVERAVALTSGYTSTSFGYHCVNLPFDSPLFSRTLNVYAEFENKPTPK